MRIAFVDCDLEGSRCSFDDCDPVGSRFAFVECNLVGSSSPQIYGHGNSMTFYNYS